MVQNISSPLSGVGGLLKFYLMNLIKNPIMVQAAVVNVIAVVKNQTFCFSNLVLMF